MSRPQAFYLKVLKNKASDETFWIAVFSET